MEKVLPVPVPPIRRSLRPSDGDEGVGVGVGILESPIIRIGVNRTGGRNLFAWFWLKKAKLGFVDEKGGGQGWNQGLTKGGVVKVWEKGTGAVIVAIKGSAGLAVLGNHSEKIIRLKNCLAPKGSTSTANKKGIVRIGPGRDWPKPPGGWIKEIDAVVRKGHGFLLEQGTCLKE